MRTNCIKNLLDLKDVIVKNIKNLKDKKDIAFTYFRKAKIVADHFHFARYVCNAVNDIRIAVQKELPNDERKYFKHSRTIDIEPLYL